MSGCDSDRLEALLEGEGEGTAETRAHVAACAHCAEELAWLHAERRLFATRDLAPAAPPPFAAVLGQVRQERRDRWARRARHVTAFGFAAAAALIVVAVVGGVGRELRAPALVAVAEPVADFTCYDDPRSLAVEATAYATDRAIATAEDLYGACLEATPALVLGNARERCATGSGSGAFPAEADVTCRSLWPLDDEIFASGICGGSLQ